MARLVRWLGWAIAVPAAFVVGRAVWVVPSIMMSFEPHAVEIEIAGAGISSRGGRKVEVSSGPIAVVQACAGTCDTILLSYESDPHRVIDLQARDGRGRIVVRSETPVADARSIRLDGAS